MKHTLSTYYTQYDEDYILVDFIHQRIQELTDVSPKKARAWSLLFMVHHVTNTKSIALQDNDFIWQIRREKLKNKDYICLLDNADAYNITDKFIEACFISITQ